MDLECDKFNATVAQTFDPTDIRTMIEEVCKITGTNDIPMILCNPINYEFAKESLDSVCRIYNLIKSPYVEENIITIITDPNTKNEILGYCGCKNLFEE